MVRLSIFGRVHELIADGLICEVVADGNPVVLCRMAFDLRIDRLDKSGVVCEPRGAHRGGILMISVEPRNAAAVAGDRQESEILESFMEASAEVKSSTGLP